MRKSIRRWDLTPACVKRYAAGIQLLHSEQFEAEQEMASREQTPPATKARVVLQPLRSQKLEGSTPEKQSPEIKKKKSTEEEEKEAKQESQPAPETARPIPDIKEKTSKIEKKILELCLDPSKKINKDQGHARNCGGAPAPQ